MAKGPLFSLIAIFFMITTTTCKAAMPKLVGELELGAPIIGVQFAADGGRGVAQLRAADGRPPGLQIIDISGPGKLVPRGFVSIEQNGAMALTPNGKMLLLLTLPKNESYARATPHRVTAFDLSDANQPKVLWRRDIMATAAVLAPNASGYIAREVSGPDRATWKSIITWVNKKRPPIILNDDKFSIEPSSLAGNFIFSEDASFLLVPDFWSLQVFDLRGTEPIRYTQSPFSMLSGGRYECPSSALVLDSGYIALEENFFPRIGIYAIKPHIPRVAVLSHDETRLCGRVDTLGSGDTVLFSDTSGRVREIDLSTPDRPRFTGSWQLPSNTSVLGTYGTKYLYAASSRSIDGKRYLQILKVFELNLTVPAAVDWVALANADAQAVDIYRREPNQLTGEFQAINKLEEANIRLALDAPIRSISKKKAAEILNDYGFLLWKAYAQSPPPPEAEIALRRAVKLDPTRMVVWLNLADLLRDSLPTLSDWKEKQARSREIETLYRKYLSLGGKSSARIDGFLRGDLGKNSPNDLCRVIVNYANAGRLQELVSTSATNVPVGNQLVDLVFTTAGTAHVPTIYEFNADVGQHSAAHNSAIPVPNAGNLWGGDQLGLVVYRNFYHILLYRDFLHPVASNSLSGDQHCEFKTTTVERIGQDALEPKLCRQLQARHGPDLLKFGGPIWMTREDVSKKYSEAEIAGAKLIDIANDGKPINVGRFDLASVAGPGCEEVFFDEVDRNGAHFESGPKRDLLIKLEGATPTNRYPILPCGNKADFFKYQGKTYFENEPETWPPVDQWDQYHRVTRIDNGEVVNVCNFKFETHVEALAHH